MKFKKTLSLLLIAGLAIAQISTATYKGNDNDAIKAELTENISRFKSVRDEDIKYVSLFLLATLIGIKQLVYDSPPSIFSFFTPIWAGASIFGMIMANENNNKYKKAIQEFDEIKKAKYSSR